MVMNTFTGRLVAANSPQVARLASIGIGPSVAAGTNGLLDVTDGAAFDSYFGTLEKMPPPVREKELQGLPRRLARCLNFILAKRHRGSEDARSAATPSAELRSSLAHLNAMLGQSRLTGVVAEAGTSASPDFETREAAQRMLRERDELFAERVTHAGALTLNESQQAVLDLVLRGYNVFIGGSAGCGKTALLEVARAKLVALGLSVAVTATTGVAGCHINGVTFHHAFGLGRGEEFTSHAALTRYDAVIVDEVSMMTARAFTAFDEALRRVHQSSLPFAGVQLILCGDFLQLPPVNASSLLTSPLFHTHFVHTRLVEQVRQAKSPAFAAVLEELRVGRVPAAFRELIVNKEMATVEPDAVNLLPTNKLVAEVNERQLAAIAGDEFRYSPLIRTPSLLKAWGPSFVLRRVNKNKDKGDEDGPPVPMGRQLLDSITHVKDGALRFLQTNFKELMITADDVRVYPLYEDVLVLRVAMDALVQSIEATIEKEKAKSGLPTIPVAAGAAAALGASREAGDRAELMELAAEYTRRFNGAMNALAAELTASKLLHSPQPLVLDHVSASGDGLYTSIDEERLHRMTEEHPLIDTARLKVGARVLLRANIGPRLVNGSIGTVIGFTHVTEGMVHPLACSPANAARVQEDTTRYIQHLQFEQVGEGPGLLPVVQFGDTPRSPAFTIPPWRFTVGGDASTNFYGVSALCLPLSLAYAFTVHRVQGLTLVGRVHLELSRMWPCEHLLYVAMSRVRTPDQLTLSCFRDEMVLADPEAVAFSEKLPPAVDAQPPPALLPALWIRSPMCRKGKQRQVKLKIRMRGPDKRKQEPASSPAADDVPEGTKKRRRGKERGNAVTGSVTAAAAAATAAAGVRSNGRSAVTPKGMSSGETPGVSSGASPLVEFVPAAGEDAVGRPHEPSLGSTPLRRQPRRGSGKKVEYVLI